MGPMAMLVSSLAGMPKPSAGSILHSRTMTHHLLLSEMPEGERSLSCFDPSAGIGSGNAVGLAWRQIAHLAEDFLALAGGSSLPN